MRGARVTKDGVIVTKGETMGVGSKIDKELTAQETRRLR